MQFVVFLVLIWIGIQLNQVMLFWPIDLAHVLQVPHLLTLALLFGLFAWLFGG